MIGKEQLDLMNRTQMVDYYLEDSALLYMHYQLLFATKHVMNKYYDDALKCYKSEEKEVPDNEIRIRALDLAYKIKGMFPRETIDLNIRRLSTLSEEELAAEIAQARMGLSLPSPATADKEEPKKNA